MTTTQVGLALFFFWIAATAVVFLFAEVSLRRVRGRAYRQARAGRSQEEHP